MTTNQVQLIEQFGNKIDGYVQVMANKAGVAVEHFWPVFIKQQQIEGIYTLITIGVMVLVGIGLLFCDRKQSFLTDDDFDCPNLRLFTSIAGVILLASVLLTSGGRIATTKIINPEYFAITKLVEMIK